MSLNSKSLAIFSNAFKNSTNKILSSPPQTTQHEGVVRASYQHGTFTFHGTDKKTQKGGSY